MFQVVTSNRENLLSKLKLERDKFASFVESDTENELPLNLALINAEIACHEGNVNLARSLYDEVLNEARARNLTYIVALTLECSACEYQVYFFYINIITIIYPFRKIEKELAI